MSEPFRSFSGRDPAYIPSNSNAYIPVRVTETPRSDGSVVVYLPSGTAFVVDARYLLRLDSAAEASHDRR